MDFRNGSQRYRYDGKAGIAARTAKMIETVGHAELSARSGRICKNMGKEQLSERAVKSAASRRTKKGVTTPVGIGYHKGKKKWIARTTIAEYGFRIQIGAYETLQEAIDALGAYRLLNPYHKS